MAIFSTSGPLFADNQDPKVVIVGAGLAGLTTAYRLQENGVNAHLFEARGRVGGRILSATVDGNIVEIGGQNIADGGDAENIQRLISELQLELEKCQINLNQSYFDGTNVISIEELLESKRFHPETLRAKIDTVAKNAFSMREVLLGLFEEDDPLYKIMAVRLAGYEGASPENLSPFYKDTLYYMLLGGIAAVHQGEGEAHSVDFSTVKGGNSLLPEKMAKRLGERLHLNKPLSQVTKTKEGGFLLTFQDEEKVEADVLVLAIPCSTYSDIVFEKGLIEDEKLALIRNVNYGSNAKILVPLPKVPQERIGLINDRSGCFLDAERKVLTLYYTGAASRFSKDSLLSTYSHERPMMEKGFKNLCPPFTAPQLAQDISFRTYEGPIGYSWPNDPYVKGSYAYIAPGQESALTSIKSVQGERVKELFAPIGGKLYFAGEHASLLLEVPGTMEAACESGERTARMILKSLECL